MKNALALLLGIAAAAAAGCGRSRADAAAVRVFAAASLAAPFEAVAKAFEAAHPDHRVELHFAGTPQLVLQIREGAAADVFAAADQPNMQKVVDAGVVAAAPAEFARNHLAIVVEAGNPRGVRDLADLARVDLKVALCGPEVPAGRYAREALAKARVTVVSRSDEASVKALVGKVQLHELDAGIVYATDTRVAGVSGVPVAAEHDVLASYPIAVLSRGGNHEGGEAFVAFVRGEKGRELLRAHGFEVP